MIRQSPSKRPYTLQKAAERLGVTRQAVEELLAKGILKPYRPRVPEKNLWAFLEEHGWELQRDSLEFESLDEEPQRWVKPVRTVSLRHSREMTRVCSRKVTRGRDDTNTRFAAFAVRQIPRRRFDRSATANHLLGMRGLHAFGVDDNAAHTLALRQSCSYCGSLLLSTNGSFLASADGQSRNGCCACQNASPAEAHRDN